MPIQIGKSPLELSPTLSKRKRKRSTHDDHLQNSPKQIKLNYTEADKDSKKSPPKKTLNETISNIEPLKNSSKHIKSIDTEAKKDAKKSQHKETLSEAKTKSKESKKLPVKKTSNARKSDKNVPKNAPKIPGRKAEVVKVKTTVNSTKTILPKYGKPATSKFFKNKIGKMAPVKSNDESLKNSPKQTKLNDDKENKKPKKLPPTKISNTKKITNIEDVDDLPIHSTM